MKSPSCCYVLAAFGLLGMNLAVASTVLKTTERGAPEIKQIDVIAFAPEGVLLIGDGPGQQVVAIETGATERLGDLPDSVKGIQGRIAGRLGTDAGGVEIIDMAHNPVSGRLYFAVRKQDDKSSLLVRLGAGGELEHFPLKDVSYASIPLPQGDKAPVSKITDVVWVDGRLVAAARCNEEFASKIFATRGPLVHKDGGSLVSAETYHVQHGRWETKAPMSVMMPYEEDGKHYIVGAFSCTPVVKYPVEALESGAKIKGISMIELGSGNRPLDMFSYEKGGKTSVLTNTFRFHHERRPFGPSPYWACRFDETLLADREKTNEKAVRRLGRDYKPATDGIELVEPYHGVVQMDRLDAKHAVALRDAGEDLDLVKVPLP